MRKVDPSEPLRSTDIDIDGEFWRHQLYTKCRTCGQPVFTSATVSEDIAADLRTHQMFSEAISRAKAGQDVQFKDGWLSWPLEQPSRWRQFWNKFRWWLR